MRGVPAVPGAEAQVRKARKLAVISIGYICRR